MTNGMKMAVIAELLDEITAEGYFPYTTIQIGVIRDSLHGTIYVLSDMDQELEDALACFHIRGTTDELFTDSINKIRGIVHGKI